MGPWHRRRDLPAHQLHPQIQTQVWARWGGGKGDKFLLFLGGKCCSKRPTKRGTSMQLLQVPTCPPRSGKTGCKLLPSNQRHWPACAMSLVGLSLIPNRLLLAGSLREAKDCMGRETQAGLSPGEACPATASSTHALREVKRSAWLTRIVVCAWTPGFYSQLWEGSRG